MMYAVIAALLIWVMLMLPLLFGWLERRRVLAQENARTFLARRGYRLNQGVLFRVTHEDDEGWWRGDPLASGFHNEQEAVVFLQSHREA